MTDEDEELRRRKYPRVNEACNVKYHVVEDAAVPARNQGGVAVNISGGGMCFSADGPLEPGSMVALEMTLSDLPTPVVSLGRVVWSEPSEEAGKFDVGVEFWWIGWADEEAQNRMLGYINQKLGELGIGKDGEAS